MENKEISKPLGIKIDECKQNISNAIQSSELSVFIVELILQNIYTEITQLSMKARQQEITEYLLKTTGLGLEKSQNDNNEDDLK